MDDTLPKMVSNDGAAREGWPRACAALRALGAACPQHSDKKYTKTLVACTSVQPWAAKAWPGQDSPLWFGRFHNRAPKCGLRVTMKIYNSLCKQSLCFSLPLRFLFSKTVIFWRSPSGTWEWATCGTVHRHRNATPFLLKMHLDQTPNPAGPKPGLAILSYDVSSGMSVFKCPTAEPTTVSRLTNVRELRHCHLSLLPWKSKYPFTFQWHQHRPYVFLLLPFGLLGSSVAGPTEQKAPRWGSACEGEEAQAGFTLCFWGYYAL